MEIVNVFMDHWLTILIVAVVIVALLLVMKKAETEILKQILFKLVTEAESTFGPGTGELKLATVIDWIYERIPAIFKGLFTVEDLKKMVEDVLVQAKESWANNPELGDYTSPEQTEEQEEVKEAELKDIIKSTVEEVMASKKATKKKTTE